MTSGDGRSVTYTAFDKPDQINRGTTAARFFYGPDRARFKREDISSSGTTVTHYVGGKAFERIIAPGGAQTDKHYIGGFAVVTHAGVGPSATVLTDYLHRDHLGSVEAISDTAGALVTQLSFDSWGRRRQGNWQPMTDAAIYAFDTTLTTRGYTGHEQLDPVGLVHMNGRVYDPTIGRFLSADPHVQAPGDLQNWNRYSYVMNNPLSYTDPTGFFFKKLFRSIGKAFGKVFKAIGAAFKKILRSPIFRAIIQVVGCALTAAATAGLGCVAITAGLTLAAGGSVADALQAAAFAFASMGVWDVVGGALQAAGVVFQQGVDFSVNLANAAIKGVVHGVVGGALAVAQGGNFLQGFVANAIGGAAGFLSNGIGGGDFGSVTARTVLAAVAGCAGAALSGGKCANGAVTAAFAHLFNNEALFRMGANRMASDELRAQRGLEARDHDVAGTLADTVATLFGGAGGKMAMAVAPAARRMGFTEAKRLIRLWQRDPIKRTRSANIRFHFGKHGGGKPLQSYLRSAEQFSREVRGSGKPVRGLTPGVRRWTKNGRFIDKNGRGEIVSYGR